MEKCRLDLRDPTERERLAARWLDYAESLNEDRLWADETLSDLIDDDPCLAWEIILELLHRAPNPGVLGVVAAGPLEDLVAWHGREVIGLIEQRAHEDETLRRGLSHLCVGRDTLDPVTLERLRHLGVERIG